MTETVNSAKTQNCQWCGMIHTTPGVCSRVKAFEYFPDGTLKRVEFKTAADYPQQVDWSRQLVGRVGEAFAGRPNT